MNHQDTEMQVVIVGAGRADLVAQTKVSKGGRVVFTPKTWRRWRHFDYIYLEVKIDGTGTDTKR